MDTEVLVDDRIAVGRQLVGELAREGVDITVALWARTLDEGLWFLYLGTEIDGPEALGELYKKLYACLTRVPDSGLTISDVKFIPPSHPLAKYASGLRDSIPMRRHVRVKRVGRKGGLDVGEVYVYPHPCHPMTVAEVLRTIANLMIDRNGPITPSLLTLKDGSKICGAVMGLDLRHPIPSTLTVMEGPGVQRVVPADEVVNVE